MIPLRYNFRNLRVRWVTTTLTVLGTALVVWSTCLLFMLAEGLQKSLEVSGDPLDLIILRRGSTVETNSGFDEAKAQDLANLKGIARDNDGRPLVSSEIVNIPVVERSNGSRANLIIRGVDQATGPELRPSFKIVQGRMFEPGRGECVVSSQLAGRFKGASLGGEVRCGEKEAYRVVGVFTAGGGAPESEVWVDRKDLARNTGREGSVSCVQLRALSNQDMQAIQKTLGSEQQFRLDALTESDYYASQTRTANFFKVAGGFIAFFLTLGAMFAAANTMYSAVSSRTREIGTMRALGFSQFDVLLCFLGESVLLCLLGGALGLLATIPMSAVTFATNDFTTFSERSVNFRFGPLVAIVAVVMTTAMGVVGGFFPALRAVRLDVIKALREL